VVNHNQPILDELMGDSNLSLEGKPSKKELKRPPSASKLSVRKSIERQPSSSGFSSQPAKRNETTLPAQPEKPATISTPPVPPPANVNSIKERRNWQIHLLYIRQNFRECLRIIEEQLKESNGMCEYPLYIKGL
jgi:hypothetical protein